MKKTIYLAGGCFWGVEGYFKKITGVLATEVGYANGDTLEPSYKQVCTGNTNHSETVKVEFEDDIIKLDQILRYFFLVIDPTSLNRQGGDIGTQYRTGIYYINQTDKDIIQQQLNLLASQYKDKIVVENLPLSYFYPAEDYHQDYLDNNPNGYCHINLSRPIIPLSEI